MFSEKGLAGVRLAYNWRWIAWYCIIYRAYWYVLRHGIGTVLGRNYQR
jgi:hypothetical protein